MGRRRGLSRGLSYRRLFFAGPAAAKKAHSRLAAAGLRGLFVSDALLKRKAGFLCSAEKTPAAPVRPETQAYQPVPKQASETVAYKPVSAPNETTAYKPVQRDETTAYSPAATHQRQRRSERHRNQDGENNQ